MDPEKYFMSFFYPWLLILLPLPLIWRLLLHYLPSLKRLSQRILPEWERVAENAILLPTFQELNQLVETHNRSQIWRGRIGITWAIWILLVLSLAQPLWIDKHQPLPMTGRDLMLLVDVSGSMRKMDFIQNEQPISRLGMVKQIASRFVERRIGDRVGLILFGNKPHLRGPLSHDRKAISHLIQQSEIALAGESTAIGDAIGLAIKRMREIKSESRVIVLLTDGANNEGIVNPRKAAELAASQGIKIYTIGIGGEEAPAPNPYDVWSSEAAQAYEKEVLEEVAELTGGYFFHVMDGLGLQQAYERLDQLEPAFTQNIYKYLAKPLYPWFLGLALILSVLAVWKGWLPIMVSALEHPEPNTHTPSSESPHIGHNHE